MPSEGANELALTIILDTLKQEKNYKLQDLQEFFPDMSEMDLKKSLNELENNSFIKIKRDQNGDDLSIFPLYNLYLHYEDEDYGYNPHEDICSILKQSTHSHSTSSEGLSNSLGMPIARVNRAIEFIKANNLAKVIPNIFSPVSSMVAGLSPTKETIKYLKINCIQETEDYNKF